MGGVDHDRRNYIGIGRRGIVVHRGRDSQSLDLLLGWYGGILCDFAGIVHICIGLGVSIDDGVDVIVQMRLHLALLHMYYILPSPYNNYWNLDLYYAHTLDQHVDPPLPLHFLLCLLGVDVGLSDDAITAFDLADHYARPLFFLVQFLLDAEVVALRAQSPVMSLQVVL